MINLIKEYIESGNSFEDLKTEYGINVNEFDNLICLNYDQIESPKSPNIVRQCSPHLYPQRKPHLQWRRYQS